MGEMIGTGLVAIVTLWFIFAKAPEPDRFSRKVPAPGTPVHDPPEHELAALERDYQILTHLERIEARPTYVEEYHDHHHYAPEPQQCRHCRAANQPYAPTCAACGAPIY